MRSVVFFLVLCCVYDGLRLVIHCHLLRMQSLWFLLNRCRLGWAISKFITVFLLDLLIQLGLALPPSLRAPLQTLLFRNLLMRIARQLLMRMFLEKRLNFHLIDLLEVLLKVLLVRLDGSIHLAHLTFTKQSNKIVTIIRTSKAVGPTRASFGFSPDSPLPWGLSVRA
jgi:hypothetical protein